MIIPMIFAMCLGVFQYFSPDIIKSFPKYYNKILSFSAGISVSYIFLHMIPMFTVGAITNNYLYLSVLVGFVVFHLIEKYIYKHSTDEKLSGELAIEDTVTSMIYHMFIGILFYNIAQRDIISAFLFFIPILLYTALNTLPVYESSIKTLRVLAAVSSMIGVVMAKFINGYLYDIIFFSIMGFMVGALIFTIMRHSIPKGKKGEPIYFLIAVIIYSLMIYLI